MAGVYYCAQHGCDISNEVLGVITLVVLGIIIIPTAVLEIIRKVRKK